MPSRTIRRLQPQEKRYGLRDNSPALVRCYVQVAISVTLVIAVPEEIAHLCGSAAESVF